MQLRSAREQDLALAPPVMTRREHVALRKQMLVHPSVVVADATGRALCAAGAVLTEDGVEVWFMEGKLAGSGWQAARALHKLAAFCERWRSHVPGQPLFAWVQDGPDQGAARRLGAVFGFSPTAETWASPWGRYRKWTRPSPVQEAQMFEEVAA